MKIICQARQILMAGALVVAAGAVHAAAFDPLPAGEWNRDKAAHLLARAGFGGTPEEIDQLARLTPRQAVRRLVYFDGAPKATLPAFAESGVFQPGFAAFPPSRPATTDLAKARGEAIGVKVKPGGNRRLQPVTNQFFYWLRASRLETHRVNYWWAQRMLATPRPFEEKMALFWHGHFATTEDKVRDYRKMLKQLELFQREGRGNFQTLLLKVAQDPAMLAFLDAGINVKGAPNENFAREIMELFSMGVGNYSEQDIREAARAFTGWNFDDLRFKVDPAKHDDGEKTVLGRTGRLTGEDVIATIVAQPVTAEYVAGKLYAFFVRTEPEPDLRRQLGELLRQHRYEIAPFMETLLLSRDFYAPDAVGTHIKSPVELVVSTYRKLGLHEMPGVPDFNESTGALGQRLLYPPTVAGWAGGRSWITPGLLLQRGNFAFDLLFPDIGFIPEDRYPTMATGAEIRAVHERIRAGMSISTATLPVGKDSAPEQMAMSNRNTDQDEDFNTRYASYRGWQMAIERVKPIPRTLARIDLTGMILRAGCRTPLDTVRYLERRFLAVPLDDASRADLARFLEQELGGADLPAAVSYAEDALRLTLHLIMSRPEYQLG
ncbi:MAG: DUF1800 domain-containing protein [Azonexaceae bacterium]|nr:DUF1800 domain-containing protein [Azonexaceae bacterium]